MADAIKVFVAGALGKMGRETVMAVKTCSDLQLVGAADVKARNHKLSSITGDEADEDMIYLDLEEALSQVCPDVLIDFTNPQSVYHNAVTALKQGIHCVIGTTGMNQSELKALDALAREMQKGIAVIPNFSMGAVLMMKLSQEVARYFPNVEIIELHHDEKLDAPSGTAIKTAEIISEARGKDIPVKKNEFEKYSGARGGRVNGVPVHSVRLPGLIAHQEVIFGGPGQYLTIRHDAVNRECYMPGVLLVVKKIMGIRGLIVGLEPFM